jgi:hypothetical protein
MLTVYYSDGSQETYDTPEKAQKEIEETVFGCDFAVTVDSIDSDDGQEYGCTWSVKVEAQ